MRTTIVLTLALSLAVSGCALPGDAADPCAAECGEQGSAMTGVSCETCDGRPFCQCYDPAWWTDNEERVPGPGQMCQGIRYIGGCGKAPWETGR